MLPPADCDAVFSMLLTTSSTTRAIKGEEERDLMFARLFGLFAFVNSGILFQSTHSTLDHFRQTIQGLIGIYRAKTWIRESVGWAILTLLQGLIEARATVPWTADALDVALESLYGAGNEWTPEKIAWTIYLQEQGLVRTLMAAHQRTMFRCYGIRYLPPRGLTG